MFDIMDMLINFLCPTSQSASSCQNFLSASSHQVLMPFGPMIYFLFFPTVFMLLFLWIVFGSVVKGNRAINLLMTIAVYVFIIIQGFYPVFLWLGEFWIIAMFLLGFLYLLKHRLTGGGGGGGKGGGMAAPGGGSIAEAISRGAKKKIEKKALKQLGLLTSEERIIDDIEEKAKKHGVKSLEKQEQMLLAARYGVPLYALTDDTIKAHSKAT